MAKGLHVRISKEAHEAWMSYCAANGVTMTALVEVAGRRGPATVFSTKAIDAVLVEARQLDHERRAAGGPRKSV